jgi:hypothetical protein
MIQKFFLKIFDRAQCWQKSVPRLFINIQRLILLMLLFSSCSYYASTKQSQVETTPFYVDKDIKQNYPILSVPYGFEIISIDNKPIHWTSKYKNLSLPEGKHVIEISIRISVNQSYETNPPPNAINTEILRDGFIKKMRFYKTRTYPFTYKGVLTYDFKRKVCYYLSSNDQYNSKFKFQIKKKTFLRETLWARNLLIVTITIGTLVGISLL